MNMKISFNLTSNFELIPEGERTLEITKAEAKPSGKPNAIYVTFKDSEKGMMTNRYDLNNLGGQRAFGILARICLGLSDSFEFDTATDLPKMVNKKVLCEVKHTQGTQAREDGTFPTFVNITKTISLVDNNSQAMGIRDSLPTQDDDLD